MTANVKLAERLEALMRPSSYIWGNLERARKFTEILMALRSPSPAQGTYSVEDIDEWRLAHASPLDPTHHTHGIAAWKSAQPPATNDVPKETALPKNVITLVYSTMVAAKIAVMNAVLCASRTEEVEHPGVVCASCLHEMKISERNLNTAITALAKQLEAGGK